MVGMPRVGLGLIGPEPIVLPLHYIPVRVIRPGIRDSKSRPCLSQKPLKRGAGRA